MSLEIPNKPRERLVVYTVLLGSKEALGSPLSDLLDESDSDIDIDFICFTDNKDLQSDTWSFIYIEDKNLPPEKLSRRPKTLPHLYLAEWSYSLYIDNIVTFKRLPNSSDLSTTHPYLFKAYRHAYRNNLQQEADVIAMLGYDDIDTIHKQLKYYAELMPLESISPFHTCTVIFRNHNHSMVQQHGQLWWEQFLCYSKRDQMSFDFAIKRSGCMVEPLPGLKHDNNLIHNPLNTGKGRVKANFDDVKYGWLHRHIPEAKSNPKAHFLTSQPTQSSIYDKKPRILEYICRRSFSSLGQTVAPRRSIADTLGDQLSKMRGTNGNTLLVHVKNESDPLAFLPEEFSPAANSITQFLPQHSSHTLEVSVETLKNGHIFSNLEHLYNVTILLGVPPENIRMAFQAFVPSWHPGKGICAILTSGSNELEQVESIRKRIADHFAVNCDVSVNQSLHDNLSCPIPNSLIFFEWSAKMHSIR